MCRKMSMKLSNRGAFKPQNLLLHETRDALTIRRGTLLYILTIWYSHQIRHNISSNGLC
jgi:hypothetical protein